MLQEKLLSLWLSQVFAYLESSSNSNNQSLFLYKFNFNL